MKALIGTILITIISRRAGNCMRATGITRITANIAMITDTTTIIEAGGPDSKRNHYLEAT
jgi:hypothetical protein